MTGARKRKNVVWEADSPTSDAHAYLTTPGREGQKKRVAGMSLCSLPRPKAPHRGAGHCRPCDIALGRTW